MYSTYKQCLLFALRKKNIGMIGIVLLHLICPIALLYIIHLFYYPTNSWLTENLYNTKNLNTYI